MTKREVTNKIITRMVTAMMTLVLWAVLWASDTVGSGDEDPGELDSGELQTLGHSAYPRWNKDVRSVNDCGLVPKDGFH